MILSGHFFLIIFSFFIVSSYCQNDTESISRRLQRGSKREIRRANIKTERMKKLVKLLEELPIPEEFVPQPWCKPHNPAGPVVFAAAMTSALRRADAKSFVGTLRKTGYKGDIVLAVLEDSGEQFIEALKSYDAIAYTVKPDCSGEGHGTLCNFKGQTEKFSINMIRYHIYQWWATKYPSDTLIMISDFRDVFFQANPFEYKYSEWSPPSYQMVVFQEAFPNKVIYRCPFNSEWIRQCYGEENLRKVQSNTVSCSGVSMGTRDAILVYSYLVVQQLDPIVRYGRNTTVTSNRGCVSLGMDQGLHNWLIYSGQLEKYMNLKIYQQGEGPVNTVGALNGARAVLKWNLETWTVVRGTAPNKYFYNWNNDLSPVIHQADRFLDSDFGGHYENHLAVLNDLRE